LAPDSHPLQQRPVAVLQQSVIQLPVSDQDYDQQLIPRILHIGKKPDLFNHIVILILSVLDDQQDFFS